MDNVQELMSKKSLKNFGFYLISDRVSPEYNLQQHRVGVYLSISRYYRPSIQALPIFKHPFQERSTDPSRTIESPSSQTSQHFCDRKAGISKVNQCVTNGSLRDLCALQIFETGQLSYLGLHPTSHGAPGSFWVPEPLTFHHR